MSKDLSDLFRLLGSILVIGLIFSKLIFYGLSRTSATKQLSRWSQTSLNKQGSRENPAVVERKNVNDYAILNPEVDKPKGHNKPTHEGNWWTSQKLWELERRAIFSKAWLYAGHQSRFVKPGDYQVLEIAGFSFFITLGKDGVLRAFHNICRHRAYPVIQKASGSSIVLSCRYHGWCYNTRGELVKAPKFENVTAFDKTKNGLFEIHVRVSDEGLIFVNFDASQETTEWEVKEVLKLSKSLQLKCHSSWIERWDFSGNFNWKLASRLGTNTTVQGMRHGLLRDFLSHIPFLSKATETTTEEESYDFPNTRFRSYPAASCWISIQHLPLSALKTLMHVDLYGTGTDTKHVSETFLLGLKQELQDYVDRLEKHQNQLLEIITEGSMAHGFSGEDDICKQERIAVLLKRHSQQEEEEGRKISPAFRNADSSEKAKEADDLCKKLDRLSASTASLGTTLGCTELLRELAW